MAARTTISEHIKSRFNDFQEGSLDTDVLEYIDLRTNITSLSDPSPQNKKSLTETDVCLRTKYNINYI